MRSVEFHSSVQYASFQSALMAELRAAGWEASEHFQVAQSEYWDARSRRARWAMRTQTYGVYPARLAAHVARRRDTVSVVCTNTFFAPWLAEVVAGRRGPPVVHWVFDLFPDVLLLAGRLRPGMLAERLLRRWVRATFDRAAANVFLGARLLSYACQRFGPIPRAHVIPVGCDARAFGTVEPEPRAEADTVRILYCGNLGRMHDVATIAEALQCTMPANLAFEFRGNGAGFRALECAMSSAAQQRVQLGGNLPEAQWVAAMRAADVALVTMRRGAEGVVVPSKAYAALAAGQAVLAICPRLSDLADTVLQHDCGWVVEPGDRAGLLRVLEEIASDRNGVWRRRRNAWRAGHEVYDQRVLSGAWLKVLNSVHGRAW